MLLAAVFDDRPYFDADAEACMIDAAARAFAMFVTAATTA